MGKVVTVKNIKKKEIMVIFEIIFCNYIISIMNMQYNQNQNQSCDCSGNNGNGNGNNGIFNMNNGNPQHQLNLNNQMNNQIHNHQMNNHQMNNQMPQQLDLSSAMGIPTNTVDLNTNLVNHLI